MRSHFGSSHIGREPSVTWPGSQETLSAVSSARRCNAARGQSRQAYEKKARGESRQTLPRDAAKDDIQRPIQRTDYRQRRRAYGGAATAWAMGKTIPDRS